MTAPVLNYKPEETRSLVSEVMELSGQNLLACYQCRRCAAGCPVGIETGYVTPDRLIRMIVLGDREQALENELVWKCVSCYTCGTRCPNDIMTGRITEALKQMVKKEHKKVLKPKIANFHDAFVGSAVQWGRLNEVEFMGRYETKNSIDEMKKGNVKGIVEEMLAQMKFALPMLKNKRMHFGFQKSKGAGELKKFYKKAKEKLGL